MPDPIHGVNTTDPVGVASTGQPGTAQAAVSTVPPPAGTGVDSADVAKAEALLAAIKKAADAVPAIAVRDTRPWWQGASAEVPRFDRQARARQLAADSMSHGSP